MSIPSLIAMGIILCGSCFFSGTETALFSLTPNQLRRFKKAGKASKTVVALISNHQRLLIAILLGNTTVNVAYFTVAGRMSLELGKNNPTLGAMAGIGSLLCIILLGEVLPKQMAASHPERWAKTIALPLFNLMRITHPLLWVTQNIVIGPLARILQPNQNTGKLNATELSSLLETSVRHGYLASDEMDTLQRVLELGRLKVRDIMIPRIHLRAHDINDAPEQLIEQFQSTRLSQLPVYDQSLDQILGFASARRVLLAPPKSVNNIKGQLHTPYFVPENASLENFLDEAKRQSFHAAIVVDEYGGTEGLITVEDAVEQIIGNLPGSYQMQETELLQPIDDSTWRVHASLPIHQLIRAMPGVLPEEATTLGGALMAQLQRLPEVGDSITNGPLTITVESMEDTRIAHLILHYTANNKAGNA